MGKILDTFLKQYYDESISADTVIDLITCYKNFCMIQQGEEFDQRTFEKDVSSKIQESGSFYVTFFLLLI